MGESVTRQQSSVALAPTSRVAHAVEHQRAAAAVGIFAIVPRSYSEMMSVAQKLYTSGLLGSKIKSENQAFAIIVAGAELGMPPMLALRSIGLIDGKMVIQADAQLGAFKRAGGRAEFLKLDENGAQLKLVHPNGDRHTETFTWDMAVAAGLAAKENYKKHRKAMLRSRCVTAGLKSIGFEPVAGMYDPDEAQHFSPPEHEAALEQEAADVAREREGMTEEERELADQRAAADTSPIVGRIPYGDYRGQRYDSKDADGYIVSADFCQKVVDWASGKAHTAAKAEDVDAANRFNGYADDAQRELDRREAEALAAIPAPDALAGEGDPKPQGKE